MNRNYNNLEKKIGYSFNDKGLLETALTHASLEQERKDLGTKIESNQRLEFLGDAVLDVVVGEELYKRLPDADEGQLTRARASIVSQDPIAKIGLNLEIGEYLVLTKGESNSGGRQKKAILADAVEALIGAIYLDCEYAKGKEIVRKIFQEEIDKVIREGVETRDYKSKIQENLQGKTSFRGEKFSKPITTEDIRYRVIKEEGPPHDRSFVIELEIKGRVIGVGTGKSKKEGEQQAAKMALEER